MLLLNFILGSIFLILGIVFKMFPPKKINSMLGYRTGTSVRNQDTWDEANMYSAWLLIITGASSVLIGLICHFIFNVLTGYLITAGMSIIILLTGVFLTEAHLKKTFDNDGTRKSLQQESEKQ